MKCVDAEVARLKGSREAQPRARTKPTQTEPLAATAGQTRHNGQPIRAHLFDNRGWVALSDLHRFGIKPIGLDPPNVRVVRSVQLVVGRRRRAPAPSRARILAGAADHLRCYVRILDAGALPFLLTVKEAVLVSHLSRSFLYEAMVGGRLERRKSSRAIRIVTASLVKLVTALPM